MLTRSAFTAVFITLTLCAAVCAAPIDWDHVHLMAPDTKAAAEWYQKLFGGAVTKSGPFDAVLFGTNLVKFRKGEGEVKRSEGSAIDHIGFSFDDIQAKLDAVTAAGGKVLQPPREVPSAGFTYSMAEDPWGTKIEVLNDKDLLGFHHVHLISADPAATMKWYSEVYGGEITTFKGLAPLPSIKYNSMWLICTKSVNPVVPSPGTSIDHIGFTPVDFKALIATLESKGATFDVGPQKSGDHWMAFARGPEGVKIEIVGRPE